MPTAVDAAQRALRDVGAEKLGFWNHAYFTAIAEGQLPAYFHRRFSDFRHRYTDDLPSPSHDDTGGVAYIIPLDAPSNKKCRLNVIYGIMCELRLAIKEGVLERSVAQTMLDHEWNGARGAAGEHPTLPEEITLINDSLDAVLGYLCETYGLRADAPKF